MTTEEMLIIDSVASDEFKEWLKSRPRPDKLLGKVVPTSLDDLTYGELAKLQMCGTTAGEAIVSLCEIILGINNVRKIMRADADKMAGFIFWASAEVERISKLFAAIQKPPTPDEIQAGVLDLNFGAFGTADWYALRMGMTNHDDAFATKWIRIYECMKKDSQLEAYRERLSKIKMNKK